MTGNTDRIQTTSPTDAVLQRSERTPRTVALRVYESGLWVEYGWDDVARTVARVAALAADAGVQPGSVVALVCGSRPEWAVCVWAATGLGATVVAVDAQSDVDTIETIAARRPALWILEGLEPFDTLTAAGVSGDISRLVLDAADLPAAARRGIHEWERDVLGSRGSDEERLADLRRSVTGSSPDAVALILPDEGVELTRADLVADGDTAHRVQLDTEDEYLSFLPPTWVAEARLLVGDHPVTGAVVSLGSRSGTGLREVAAIQPTVVQAPAEWWRSLAETVTRQAAEPAPLARGALRTLLDGGDGLGARLARRTLCRRLGLARLRDARVLGEPDATSIRVLDGLRVPLGAALERPRPLGPVTAAVRSEDQAHLEEVR